MFFSKKYRQQIEDRLDQLEGQNLQLLERSQELANTIQSLDTRIREGTTTIVQHSQETEAAICEDIKELAEKQQADDLKLMQFFAENRKIMGEDLLKLFSSLHLEDRKMLEEGTQKLLLEIKKEVEAQTTEMVSKVLTVSSEFGTGQTQKILSAFQESTQENHLQQERILNAVFDLQNVSRAMIPNPLFTVELHVVEHCNLNCKMCSHFSCIAEEEYLEPACLERDMARLAQLFDCGVNRIRLLGGEPLLHPQLPLLLEISRKYFPQNRIELVTNGVKLAEQSEVFWETCRRCQIVVLCSEYPISINYRDLERLATEKGVSYQTERVSRNNQHCLPLKLDLLTGPENRSRGRRAAMENFCRCFLVNTCISLYQGKLFPCAVACNIRHFNRFFHKELPISKHDYIDIHEVQSAEEIIRFLSRPIPFCQFCDVPNRKFGLMWGPTERDIKEWSL